jgi:hypothetical protein
MDSEAFIAYYTSAVHELAMLAHRSEAPVDPGASQRLVEVRAPRAAGGRGGPGGAPASAWQGLVGESAHSQQAPAFPQQSLQPPPGPPPPHPDPQLLHDVGAHALGLCIGHMWFYGLFNTNLASRAAGAAPPAVWDRVARGMRLTPEQVGGAAGRRRSGAGWAAKGRGGATEGRGRARRAAPRAPAPPAPLALPQIDPPAPPQPPPQNSTTPRSHPPGLHI